MHKFLHHIVIVIAFAVSGYANAASFNCAKASTKVEKMICLDANLSELDVQLAKIYKVSLSKISTKNDKQTYRKKQLTWLKNVRNTCNDEQCLSRVYSERITVLDNPHKITATGAVGVGAVDSSIGNKAKFFTLSETANNIFNKCGLQDVCQVTGTVDGSGYFITVSDVKLLHPSKK